MKNYFIKFLVCCFMLFGGAAYAQKITFDLVDERGPVTQESYPGKYLLLAIGYTSCPDICPTTLYEYGLTMKAIKNPDAIQPIFVTIDPANDDVARLNAYTRYFDERIVGLSGSMENIQNLADQIGATFGYRANGKKIDNPVRGMSYTVYHSALIYLISPEREILDVYDYQIGDEDLTAALDKVLGEAPQAKAETSDVVTSNSDGAAEQAATAKKASTQNTAANNTSANSANNSAKTADANCELPTGFKPSKEATELASIVNTAPDAKVSLLNLWAIWCEPCRKELPILDGFAAQQKEMAIVTLNLNDKADKISDFYVQNKIQHLSQESTNDGKLLRRLGGMGLPFNALFVEGKAVAIKSGIIDETDSLSRYAQCMQAAAH